MINYQKDVKKTSVAKCGRGDFWREVKSQKTEWHINARRAVKAAVKADLDGDGAYDYVIKTPRGGTDPWDLVWKPAKDTHKLEAYTSTGRFLWRRDLGWNIEMGIWYSPFLVADVDGDGKAEVITKTAPLSPDLRDPDGRVQPIPTGASSTEPNTSRSSTDSPARTSARYRGSRARPRSTWMTTTTTPPATRSRWRTSTARRPA